MKAVQKDYHLEFCLINLINIITLLNKPGYNNWRRRWNPKLTQMVNY